MPANAHSASVTPIALADPRDQQAAREPANAGQRDAVASRSDARGKPRQDAERQPDSRQEPNQDEVITGGRNRVHVPLRDEEHHHQRNHQTTNIQLPLARLAKNNNNKDCVDEGVGSRHTAMII